MGPLCVLRGWSRRAAKPISSTCLLADSCDGSDMQWLDPYDMCGCTSLAVMASGHLNCGIFSNREELSDTRRRSCGYNLRPRITVELHRLWLPFLPAWINFLKLIPMVPKWRPMMYLSSIRPTYGYPPWCHGPPKFKDFEKVPWTSQVNRKEGVIPRGKQYSKLAS